MSPRSRHTGRGRARGLLGLGLLATACGSDPGSRGATCEPLSGEPAVEIRDGRKPHAPLSEGDVVPVEYGLQGGMHVRLSVACAGLDPGSATLVEGLEADDLPEVTWSVGVDGEELSREVPRRAVQQEERGSMTLLEPQLVVLRYYADPPATFEPAAREAELEAQPARIDVTVTDHCGRSATDSLEVRLEFPGG